MAMAARTTLVEVEEDILPVGAIDPDQVHTSGVFVHRMVRHPATTRRLVADPRQGGGGIMSGAPQSLRQGPRPDAAADVRPPGGRIPGRLAGHLGLGIPTLCSNAAFGDRQIIFHSENGVIGYGALAKPGHEDLHLTNAGAQYVTLNPGAAIVASRRCLRDDPQRPHRRHGAGRLRGRRQWRFRQLEDGRPEGRRASAARWIWRSGAKHVYLAMEHNTRDGKPRLVERCAHPGHGARRGRSRGHQSRPVRVDSERFPAPRDRPRRLGRHGQIQHRRPASSCPTTCRRFR
ncbi:MAG: CoA-transferase [Pseudomonadota bacterium]